MLRGLLSCPAILQKFCKERPDDALVEYTTNCMFFKPARNLPAEYLFLTESVSLESNVSNFDSKLPDCKRVCMSWKHMTYIHIQITSVWLIANFKNSCWHYVLRGKAMSTRVCRQHWHYFPETPSCRASLNAQSSHKKVSPTP